MSRRDHLLRLRQAAPAVLPSLLLCDFGNLAGEVARLEAAGVQGLHLDVMDGVFVRNLTYGMPIVQAVRRLTDLPLDVHLMITRPERYVEQFYKAGADLITVHVEAEGEVAEALETIRRLGAAAGVAINPGTPLERLDDLVDLCDLVLVMSVDPGFGAQAFNPVALERLERVRQRVNSEVLLEVDGGINESTIAQCAAAGAQLFVVGSAIFRSQQYESIVEKLTELATV